MRKFVGFLGYLLVAILVLGIVLFVTFFQPDRSINDMKQLYTNANSQFMPLMGMQVHFRDEGNNRDSVPLLLIHGTSSSLNTFDSVVLLLKNNRRVITLDLPAFGITGPNATNEYGFAYYSTFLDSFLNTLNVQKCDIGGNSLGGGVSWEFTVAHPEKVRKLILIDATGYPIKNATGSIGFKLASTPVINNLLLYITPKALVRASLKGIYYDQNRVTDAQVDRYHDMAISKGNRAALLSTFKKGGKHDETLIATITKPTLIIWGEKDGLIPVENAYLFEKNIKGSKLVVLKNIGHVPMEEAPTKVANLIANF
jgi:pimeloyl-ACP methyl ester carboxylesterase